MKSILIVITLLLLSIAGKAQSSQDQGLIEEAIANYVLAFYEADTLKAHESVSRNLAKRGYYTQDGQIREASMSYDQLIQLAQRWKNSQTITPDAPRKITVFEVLDKIATAKVEAKWGIDYFHLAKIEGKWLIMNVLWQDYPKNN